jgi:uncharacterized Zn-finger protein
MPTSPLKKVSITTKDLPLHCPTPSMSIWDSHPRVFLSITEEEREAQCPYCGTVYQFEEDLDQKQHA